MAPILSDQAPARNHPGRAESAMTAAFAPIASRPSPAYGRDGEVHIGEVRIGKVHTGEAIRGGQG
ncbi:hypothetical protein GCM10027161_25000 [Microbispora hainanensis]